jgi:hypothetical protein
MVSAVELLEAMVVVTAAQDSQPSPVARPPAKTSLLSLLDLLLSTRTECRGDGRRTRHDLAV